MCTIFEHFIRYSNSKTNAIVLNAIFTFVGMTLQGTADPLNSAFHLTYNMVLNLLRVEEINPEYMLERSFYQFQNYASIPALIESTLSFSHTCMCTFLTVVDYCNALLYGVTDGVLRRLHSVLQSAARLITGIRRFDHITPTLRDTLHWLLISQRITFKIALMVFDCSRGRCPKCFSDVYIPVHTGRTFASKISRPR